MSDPLPPIHPDRPVLIAGPTASGKSALALDIAQKEGGVIVNADASQVFACWRIVTARPDAEEMARAPHHLYGHVPCDAPYSAGHWLREVASVLEGRDTARPIIVGGTGLYFSALTEGLADIPPTPPDVRRMADAMTREALMADLDPDTIARIDVANRARVQRAWEVARATGTGLAAWQDRTPPPLLPRTEATAIVLDAPRDWLEPRIRSRFDRMIAAGALDEIREMADRYDPARPAFRAIGVPELTDHVTGKTSLDTARDRAVIATRQYAKRQRTWFRKRMRDWTWLTPDQVAVGPDG